MISHISSCRPVSVALSKFKYFYEIINDNTKIILLKNTLNKSCKCQLCKLQIKLLLDVSSKCSRKSKYY